MMGICAVKYGSKSGYGDQVLLGMCVVESNMLDGRRGVSLNNERFTRIERYIEVYSKWEMITLWAANTCGSTSSNVTIHRCGEGQHWTT
jgi:hypothetical protein